MFTIMLTESMPEVEIYRALWLSYISQDDYTTAEKIANSEEKIADLKDMLRNMYSIQKFNAPYSKKWCENDKEICEFEELIKEIQNKIPEIKNGKIDFHAEADTARKKGFEVYYDEDMSQGVSADERFDPVKQAGRDGERDVDYVLKWLKPSGYRVIDKDCRSKYNNSCILLRNNNFMPEAQEFDHIVIGKNGVFMIETKNLGGTIEITRYGDWIQTKNGKEHGIKNPVQQCDRHCALLHSIVGDIPITSIICIANDGVIIEGRENCAIPIVNVSMLQRYIENMDTACLLTTTQIDKIVSTINSYKINE